MRRIRIGIHGAGALSEWGILPVLFGPDATSPPDAGAWWSRRPTASTSIRWQAPFRPEVMAVSDVDEERCSRIAGTFRIASQYSNVSAMLRENSLDAVFCEDAATQNLAELLAEMARRGAKYLWLGGAPVPSAEEALELAHWAAAHGVRIWSTRSARHAAAHRAAIRLIGRGEIGDVTALALRWSTPFCAAPESDSQLRAATFAAVDLLLASAGATPVAALLSEVKSTSQLWLRFASGATATAIFASADNWNSELPRLEICGTQGRYLVCEGGRRMGLFQPHEAARWIEPPGMALHVSSAQVNGIAEDIKFFLARCVQENFKSDNADWLGVARVLATMNAAQDSLESGVPVALENLYFEDAPKIISKEDRESTPMREPILTLPLSL